MPARRAPVACLWSLAGEDFNPRLSASEGQLNYDRQESYSVRLKLSILRNSAGISWLILGDLTL